MFRYLFSNFVYFGVPYRVLWWDVDGADVYWLMQGCFDSDWLKFGVYVDLVLRYIFPKIETHPEALFPFFLK